MFCKELNHFLTWTNTRFKNLCCKYFEFIHLTPEQYHHAFLCLREHFYYSNKNQGCKKSIGNTECTVLSNIS